MQEFYSVMILESYNLFYPMLAMFIWTFLVMILTVSLRIYDLAKGRLTNEYFQLFQGAEPSQAIVKTGNNLRNLMEFPPLFYVIALLIMFSGKSDQVFVSLAWIYFGTRLGHSVVHLTINKVPPRFLFYGISNIVLLTMWIRFGLSI
ncbi:MAPEG family protein [Nostoc flagelliforme]|uniref:MAPEG family protein n=1 Tax=Nostoc flagelliforme TaxID=1306274 RepID=UPI000C2D5B0A